MAVLNEILVGRFNRGLQKLYGVKGIVPVKALAPEIMPVHSVFSGQETRFLDGWTRFSNSIHLAQQAAATVGLRMRNPTSSNIVAIVESIVIGSAFAMTWREDQLPATLGDLTTGNPSVSLDTRQNSTPVQQLSPMCVLTSSIASPATSLQLFFASVNALTFNQVIFTSNQEQVLLPGFSLQWSTTVVNQDLNVNIQWRERFLEEPERLDLPKASIV